ncbi:sigma-70 family RNA polymerase sigma factor [Actinocorallia sp. B10E7]|uniref:RNA polymerase sigma factor n=1 Tax=Actinocorallia sp. B10E7 TaxID=3153558 RepID=UPI00325F67FF
MRSEVDVTAGELVVRAREGDASAWNTLVARYTPMLWSIARSRGLDGPTAEDAVQATWLRLVQRIDTLWEPESVGGWLATVCRNECHALFGTSFAAPRPRRPQDDVDPAPGPESRSIDRDRLERLAAALRAMPERCRTMLRMLAVSATYTEVSAALDLPVGSVGPIRARCLRRLRGSLDE